MNAKELRDKFESDLKELQNRCPHEKSTMMEYQYAPGHSAGAVDVCDVCEKILTRGIDL